jgi:hypothetical protein
VEPDFQWIVGQKVTQATNDMQQLIPTVKAVKENLTNAQTTQESSCSTLLISA